MTLWFIIGGTFFFGFILGYWIYMFLNYSSFAS